MNVRRIVGCVAFVTGLVAYAALAADWPGGAVVQITGDSVTNDAALGSISHFTDNGSLTFLPGASVTLTGNVTTAVGSGVGASGTLNLLGGSMTVTSGSGSLFIVGHLGGTGTMHIARGAEFRSNGGYVGIARNDVSTRDRPSFGEVTVAGLLATTNRLEFTGNFPNGEALPSYPVSARLILEQGGIVEVGELYKNDRAASEIIFNGGTVRPHRSHTSFIGGSGIMDIIIADGTNAVFDTAGRDIAIRPQGSPNENALTLRGETGPGSVGDGGLVKTGAGSLIFRLPAACNTFTGAVTVLEGTFDLGRPLAENQTATVHPGATFVPNDAGDFDKIILATPGAFTTYTVVTNTSDLNLVALDSLFFTDRLAGPFSNDPACVLSNTVIRSACDSAATPFYLIGNGGTLNITNTGLEDAYLQLEGPGMFSFLGSRTYTPDDIGKIVITDGGYRQSRDFSIETPAATAPLTFALPTGRFNVDGTLNVGGLSGANFAADGGTVALGNLMVGNTAGITGTFSQSAGTVTVTGTGNAAFIGANTGYGELIITGGQFIVNNNLRVASNPPNFSDNRPHGLILVSNALFRCAGLYFSSWWPTGGTARNFEAGELRLLPGGIAEVNFLEKNDDPTSTVHFAGGVLRARSNQSAFIHATHATGTLNVIADDGHSIDIDSLTYNVGMTSHPGVINFTGPGGFRKQGSGTFAYVPDRADYSGDTRIDGGTLLVGGGNAIPDGSGKGNVRIAAGAVLDVSGTSETVNRLVGTGIVTSASAPGTLGVLADGSGDTWDRAWLYGQTSLAKHGAGILTLAANQAVPENLTVHAGEVRVEPFYGYTHYRFKVEGVKNHPAIANSMQIAEIALFNGARNVTQDRIGIAYDTGVTDYVGTNPTFPNTESPELAVDGYVPPAGTSEKNKWLDFRAATARTNDNHRVWLNIIFAAPQWLTHYNWATANDNHERDPSDWLLQGSYDGKAWTDIDVRTNFYAPDIHNNWVTQDGFPVTFTQNTLGDAGLVTVRQDAALTLNGISETIGGLAGVGTVNLAAADLTFATPAGADNAFFYGTLNGSGALIKDGLGTQALYSASSTLTGSVTVREGTLLLQKVAPYSWFRLNIKECNTNSLQFSEFALYSADGQRQNLGLTLQSDPAALLPGQTAPGAPGYGYASQSEQPDKLFDNSTGSKWCTTENTPSPGDSATWRTVVMRLADDVSEITGYNLCTANDVPLRDPVAWSLEASFDGATWVEIDARAGVTPPGRLAYYNGGAPYGVSTRAIAYHTSGSSDAIPADSIVEVRAGATLDVQMDEAIGALRVDMQSAGTITRLIAEPNGTLHIVNAGDQSASGLVLPLTIGSVVNPGNLAFWTVYIDGVLASGRVLAVDSEGRLYLRSKGMIFMLQ